MEDEELAARGGSETVEKLNDGVTTFAGPSLPIPNRAIFCLSNSSALFPTPGNILPASLGVGNGLPVPARTGGVGNGRFPTGARGRVSGIAALEERTISCAGEREGLVAREVERVRGVEGEGTKGRGGVGRTCAGCGVEGRVCRGVEGKDWECGSE